MASNRAGAISWIRRHCSGSLSSSQGAGALTRKDAVASTPGRDAKANKTLEAPSLSSYLALARLLDLSLPETRQLMRAAQHVRVVAAHGADGYQSAAEEARGSPLPSLVPVSPVLCPLSAPPLRLRFPVTAILPDSTTLPSIGPAPPLSCLTPGTAPR